MRKKRQNIFIYIITLKWLFALPVLFYRKCLSPILPNVCAYYPSCSHYMLGCINRHGIKGVVFGIYRLLRCNPLTKGGYDPIPRVKSDYKKLY